MINLFDNPLILIADDDLDDCMIIKEAFEEKCPECVLRFVHDGIELSDSLEPHGNSAETTRPDLILLDLNMPLKDGRESLQELKQHPERQHIPTVIFTTSRNEDDRALCEELGADDYVVKPIRYADLLGIVDALITRWIAHRPGHTTGIGGDHD